jgi:uncharacterized protein (DUF2062 family)
VHPENPSLREVNPSQAVPRHGWFYRKTILPILALLRQGASPEQLAWSVAAGFVIGINPLLGSTTILCLAVAAICRLNIAASQIANHVAYPLQLLLFIPFLHIGTKAFHTTPLPLSPKAIMEAAREHPLVLVKELWRWEWHALVAWAAVAAVAAPVVALAITPALRRLLERVKKHQYPIIASQ